MQHQSNNVLLIRPVKLTALVVVALLVAAPAGVAEDVKPSLRPAVQAAQSQSSSTTASATKRPRKKHKNKAAAYQMARTHWLDKAAEADPGLIESITYYHGPAKILARHPRLGEIAKSDHYLCRRLTRWKDVGRLLAVNPQADVVVQLDPEGIYRAIKRDKKTARLLSRHPLFDQMIGDNPDLGTIMSQFM